MSVAPQKAMIAETGEVVDVDEVKISTILAVKAGEVIPIDGVVSDGNCEVDEKTLTGESFPVAKQKDSTVWAGTINLNGKFLVSNGTRVRDYEAQTQTRILTYVPVSDTGTRLIRRGFVLHRLEMYISIS
jgi:Cd2+/Zn2+-exporting ATPase